MTHEVIYYTIENDDCFILQEFDTLEKARSWLKYNKDEDMKWICGFKQIRDEDEDVLEEEVIYEEMI